MASLDEMADEDQGTEPGAVPKLTLTQRILTALPRLGANAKAEEPPDEAPSRPRPAATSKPRPRAEAVRSAAGRAEAGEGEGEREGEGEATGAPAPSGEVQAAPVAGRPPSAKRTGASGMTAEQLAHTIKYLDDRERLIGIVMAPLGAVVGILSTVTALHSHTHVKGQLSHGALVTLGIASLVLSGLVLVAALTRRRSFLGFALVFLGTSFGFPLLLPFWFVGGWLIFRAYKWQKELTALRGGTTGRGGTGPAPRGQQDARTMAAARASARAKKREPAPKGPSASKRYTPPKPTRPRPPAPS